MMIDSAAGLADRLLLDHLADRALAAEEDAAQVDSHDRVPVLLGRLEQRLRIAAGDARVADHHVEPSVVLDRGRHEPVDVGCARHVGVEVQATVAEQLRGRFTAFARLAHDVADDDPRALVCEAESDCATDSRASARDDRHSVLQPHRPSMVALCGSE